MIKRCRYKARGAMAYGALLSGWQVINEFANSDRIVMTIRAECRRCYVSCTMTKGTASESTGGMANTAVLTRRHMVGRFTDCSNTMTGITASISNVRVGMIDERTNESIGFMATATI